MAKAKCKECLIGRKILVTIGMLLLIRIFYFIPLPGVQVISVIEFYLKNIQAQGGGLIDLMALLHIGKLRNISLCALGIMPFINASIIVQIVSFLIPGLNRKFFYEKNGRTKMKQFTISIALVLASVHGFFISLDVELLNEFPDFNVLFFTGIPFQIVANLSLLAMVMLLILSSEIINKFGFGNGVGMIFASEIVIRLVFAADQLLVFWAKNMIGLEHLMIFSGVVVAFIYFARKITRFLSKVELCTNEDENFFISIRPSWMGIWPLIITEIVFSHFEVSFDVISFMAVALTIIFFTLLYAKIVYQPRRFYELILSHGCKINKTKTRKIIDYLNSSILRTIILSVIIFIMIYYLPIILPLVLNISFMSAGIFGTFGLIILVGVYYDIKRQVKFFRRIRSLPLKEWSLLNIAFDETEAEIKKACLRSRGIMAEIKPSHFSWGLPVGTVASNYYLYIPLEDKNKAEKIIEQIAVEWRNKAL